MTNPAGDALAVLLSFNSDKIPRSMTRAEWRACYRWLRMCEVVIDRQMNRVGVREEIDRRANNVMVYGTSHPEIYRRPER